jgi:hypothetical protein
MNWYLGSRSEKADFAVFMYSRLLVRFIVVADRRLHSGSVQAKMVEATSKDFGAQLSIVGPYLITEKNEVTSTSPSLETVAVGVAMVTIRC